MCYRMSQHTTIISVKSLTRFLRNMVKINFYKSLFVIYFHCRFFFSKCIWMTLDKNTVPMFKENYLDLRGAGNECICGKKLHSIQKKMSVLPDAKDRIIHIFDINNKRVHSTGLTTEGLMYHKRNVLFWLGQKSLLT